MDILFKRLSLYFFSSGVNVIYEKNCLSQMLSSKKNRVSQLGFFIKRNFEFKRQGSSSFHLYHHLQNCCHQMMGRLDYYDLLAERALLLS